MLQDGISVALELLSDCSVLESDSKDIESHLLFDQSIQVRKYYVEKRASTKLDLAKPEVMSKCCLTYIEEKMSIHMLKILAPIKQTDDGVCGKQCVMAGTYCQLFWTLPTVSQIKDQTVEEIFEKQNAKMKEIEVFRVFGKNENVARLLAFRYDLFSFFFLESFKAGHTLQRVLLDARQNKKPLAIVCLMEVILTTVRALQFVHSCGVLHRNITSEAFQCERVENSIHALLSDFSCSVQVPPSFKGKVQQYSRKYTGAL